ncbi:MAG: CHASE domain-containing protein, partial [Planctomycetota bacterium]
MERAEFQTFVAPILSHHPDIQALEWIPRVRDRERGTYEATARRKGFKNFRITELRRQGEMVPAARREEYFPVHYVEPLKDNEPAVGFDLGSEPSRLAALRRARRTGQAVPTKPITLVQETGVQFGFLIFVPVYRKGTSTETPDERYENLEGFVLGVFRIRDMVEEAFGELARNEIHMHFLDQSASEGEQFLYCHCPHRCDERNPVIEHQHRDLEDSPVFQLVKLEVGQREWIVQCVPSEEFIAAHKYWHPWAGLGVGLMLTGLVVLYGLSSIRHSRRIGRLAGQVIRTNRELEREVSDRRRAEEETAVFRRFAEASGQGFGIAALNGQISYVNPALCSIIGKQNPQDFSGESLISYYPPDVQRRLEEEILPAVLCGEQWIGELPLIKTDGEHVQTMECFFLIKDEDNQPIFFANAISDITESKKAQSALEQAKEDAEQANRTKGEFLAKMSHEIRTPMNGIIGMTRLALDTELTDEQREYLNMVQDSAAALLEIINDILDFSKIEAGKMDMEAVDFSLRDVVADTLGLLTVRARAKELQLKGYIAPEVPDAVVGDPTRLRQVLVNLIGNAVKFTESGEVVLRLEVKEASPENIYLHATVTDTGVGISPKQQQRIFRAFEQVDGSATREYGGTGLGLPISAQLVEMMDGHIWVESEVAKGSTFHFTARLGLQKDAPVELPDIRGMRILVVDGSPKDREMLREILNNWELQATCAAHFIEAIEQMNAAQSEGKPYRLVLLDTDTSELESFEFAKRIKEDPNLRKPPVIRLCSSDDSGETQNWEDLGISGCIDKPVKQSDLWDAIVKALLGAGFGVGETEVVSSNKNVNVQPLNVLLGEDNPINQKLTARILEKQGHRVVAAGNGKEVLE